MAENNSGPEQENALELIIKEVQKVKDIDPDVLSDGSMSDIAAELEYISDDNEIALRQQAMKELGYS
jgi:hypothetical protein